MHTRAVAAALSLLALPARAGEVVVYGEPPPATDTREPSGFVEVIEPDALPGAAADLGDVLEEAVGVQVRRAGGPGRAQYLQIRGAGAHQLAVYLDDVPLTTARGGAFDLSSLPPAWFERIEILRGAGAATYGSGAQGGVLRLVPRRAAHGHRTWARGRLGSGALAQLDAAWGLGADAYDVLLLGSASGAEGDFPYVDVNGDRRRRQNNGHQRFAGLLTGHLDAGPGRLGLLLEGAHLHRGEPGPEPQPRPESESTLQRLQGALTWAMPVGPWALSAVAHAQRRAFSFEDPAPPFGGPQGALTEDDLAGTWARLDWDGGGAHRPALAVQARYERARTRGDTTLDAHRLGAAVVLTEAWRPWRPLTLLAALRIDDTDDRDALLVPEAGLAFDLAEGITLQANVGRIFRDPSFDELYFVGPGIAGDPDLPPEDGLAWDAGLRWRLGTRFELEAVWFDHRYDPIILFVPIDAYRVRATADHAARTRGVELRAAARVHRFFVQGSYTWLDHFFTDPTFTATGAPLPYRADHRFFGRAEYHVQRAVLHTAYDYRSAAHTDRFGHRTLPGYGLWDLGVAGPVLPGLRVGLEVRNLLDARALDAVHEPLPGRTLLASVNWEG